jgi:hypothetical protein
MSVSLEKDIIEEHDASHIGDWHRMAEHRGARARKRFQKMLPSLAHLADAAGTPPYVRLGVDENRWACRVAIGNPLCREMVDVVFGSREAMRLALKKREGRGPTRELERSSAGQRLSPPRPIENRAWS